MSDSLINTIITAVVSLTGIIVSIKVSMQDITKEIEKMNVKQSTDIEYIKKDIAEMKQTLHEHNSYASKFVEMQGQLNVVLNRVQVNEHRVSDLEDITKVEIPSSLKIQAMKENMKV